MKIHHHHFSTRQAHQLLNAQHASDVHLTLWDRFKDFFLQATDAGTKADTVKKILGQLSSQHGPSDLGERLARFNALTLLAKDEHQAKFRIDCLAPDGAEPAHIQFSIDGVVLCVQPCASTTETLAAMVYQALRASANVLKTHLQPQAAALVESEILRVLAMPPDASALELSRRLHLLRAQLSPQFVSPAERKMLGSALTSWEAIKTVLTPPEGDMASQLLKARSVKVNIPHLSVEHGQLMAAVLTHRLKDTAHIETTVEADLPRSGIYRPDKIRVVDAAQGSQQALLQCNSELDKFKELGAQLLLLDGKSLEYQQVKEEQSIYYQKIKTHFKSAIATLAADNQAQEQALRGITTQIFSAPLHTLLLAACTGFSIDDMLFVSPKPEEGRPLTGVLTITPDPAQPAKCLLSYTLASDITVVTVATETAHENIPVATSSHFMANISFELEGGELRFNQGSVRATLIPDAVRPPADPAIQHGQQM